MLNFSDYIIDEKLLNSPEELHENIIKDVIKKFTDANKLDIEAAMKRAKESRDAQHLDKLSEHPHFGVRLTVAQNKHTPKETLKRLSDKGNSSEYRSVQNAASERLKAIEQRA